MLLVLEIVVPGTFALWFGLAALVVGAVTFVIDLGWQTELILFAILSLVSVLVGRFIIMRTQDQTSEEPLLNARAKALVGQVFTLSDPIENGSGRVKVHDSYWRVEGPDCPSGTKVRVVGGRETVLDVEPVDPA